MAYVCQALGSVLPTPPMLWIPGCVPPPMLWIPLPLGVTSAGTLKVTSGVGGTTTGPGGIATPDPSPWAARMKEGDTAAGLGHEAESMVPLVMAPCFTHARPGGGPSGTPTHPPYRAVCQHQEVLHHPPLCCQVASRSWRQKYHCHCVDRRRSWHAAPQQACAMAVGRTYFRW